MPPSEPTNPPSADGPTVIGPSPDGSASPISTPTVSPATTTDQPASPSPTVGGSGPAGKSPKMGKMKMSMRSMIITLVVILVVAVGGVLAYQKYSSNNKPINVLKSALLNSLQQTQAEIKLNTTATATSAGSTPFTLSLDAQENTTAKQTDINLTLGVSGYNIQAEGRLVAGNLYFKIGDLSALTAQIAKVSPTYGPIIQGLESSIANKWIEVDKSTLDSSSDGCVLNSYSTLTQSDVSLLSNQFGKYPFATVVSSSSDTLNGVAVEKYVVSIDGQKFDNFASSLDNLSTAQAISKCNGGKATSLSKTVTNVTKGTTQNITVWVNKSAKEIVQITVATTPAQAKQYNENVSATISFSYHPVTVTAPAGAEPFTELLSGLLSSSGSSQTLNL